MSRSTKTLRRPFQAIADVSSFTAKTVNKGIDGCMETHAATTKAIMSNKYVKTATKGIQGFGQGVQGKVAPFTSAAQPYVQPVVPYIEKARPYVPPAALALILLCTPPVLCFFGFIAFITAPIWLTVGFLTAFIWIPVAIFAFFTTLFLSFIAIVRYFSCAKGQAQLKRVWRQMSTTKLGQQIFYVTKTLPKEAEALKEPEEPVKSGDVLRDM